MRTIWDVALLYPSSSIISRRVRSIAVRIPLHRSIICPLLSALPLPDLRQHVIREHVTREHLTHHVTQRTPGSERVTGQAPPYPLPYPAPVPLRPTPSHSMYPHPSSAT